MDAVAFREIRSGARDEPLVLRWVDVVLTTAGVLGLVYLLTLGRWIPGRGFALGAFAAMALGPPVFRGLAARYPRVRLFELAASFWLLPSVGLAHPAMKVLAAGLNPRLMDAQLALADLKIFGAYPAQVLGLLTPGWLNDLLLLCYYSYFAWPIALGVVLYVKQRESFGKYVLALSLLYAANFVCYLAVPAVGPRLFLAGVFSGPLPGHLTPWLESIMRLPTFMRDCFPSGHTAITLLVLTFAYRHARGFFWGMLPVGMGLILATLVGRFHYGIDVLCAVPFEIAVLNAAELLARLSYRAGYVAVRGWAKGAPARA